MINELEITQLDTTLEEPVPLKSLSSKIPIVVGITSIYNKRKVNIMASKGKSINT